MTKQRADHRLRRDIGNLYGLEAANYLSSLPLIRLTPDEVKTQVDYMKMLHGYEELERGHHKGLGHRLDFALDGRRRILMKEMTEGLYMMGDPKPDDQHSMLCFTLKYEEVLKEFSDNPYYRLSSDLFYYSFPYENMPAEWRYILTINLLLPTDKHQSEMMEFLGMDYMREAAINSMFNLTPWEVQQREIAMKDPKKQKDTDNYFGRAIGIVAALHMWIEENGYYPVATRRVDATQNPKKKRVHEAKPYLKEDLVTVKFLNEMPVDSHGPRYGGDESGTHKSPTPHRRRGYTRTLKHERYRHHPLYGVEGGIRVKPAFVGDPTAVVKMVEYRLMHTK